MKQSLLIAIIVLVSVALTPTAYAGGCFPTDINGDCLKWDQNETIFWNPESGCLSCNNQAVNDEKQVVEDEIDKTNNQPGPFEFSCQISKAQENPAEYSNAFAVSLVKEAFDKWKAVPGSKIKIEQGDFLPGAVDVNWSNYNDYYMPDESFNVNADLIKHCYDNNPATPCYNSIVFDPNGFIIQDFLGACEQYSTMGVGGLSVVDNKVKHAQLIVNGICLAAGNVVQPGCGNGCGRVYGLADIKEVILHEIGHFLGMDHAQVNFSIAEQCRVNGGCPDNLKEQIPTMYPQIIKDSGQETLNIDDQVAFARLYPDPVVANRFFNKQKCTIKGYAAFNGSNNPLRCAEIIARPVYNAANPELDGRFFSEAISFISGAEAKKEPAKAYTDQTSCDEAIDADCGAFEIAGLNVGVKYRLQIQNIKSERMTIDPCYNGDDANDLTNRFVDNLNAKTFECTEARKGIITNVGPITTNAAP